MLKHIDFDFMTKKTRVIFAFCDQDIQRKGWLNLLGHVFTYNHNPKKTEKKTEMRYFIRKFEIDGSKQVSDAMRIS